MLEIDGAQGEGGGQVLRTSLALSLVTGTPVHIHHIRAGRARPGLQAQHLASVRAAALVGDALVDGDVLESRSLTFTPRGLRGGALEFSTGTAGSTLLVLHTVLPALLRAGCASTIQLTGGTHNPFAPTWEHTQHTLFPALRRLGARVDSVLERAGFYPAGGGVLRVTVEPTPHLAALEDTASAVTLRPTRAWIRCCRLPSHVAQRERQVLESELGLVPDAITVLEETGKGPGNAVMVELSNGNGATVILGALGEKRLPAEHVANTAVAQARAALALGVPVDEHLADQLLLYLALGEGGSFLTSPLTLHARTQMELIPRFVPVRIGVSTTTAGTRVDVLKGY